jgi:hypothetical protein
MVVMKFNKVKNLHVKLLLFILEANLAPIRVYPAVAIWANYTRENCDHVPGANLV